MYDKSGIHLGDGKRELKRHKIQVTSEDMGGIFGRKVMFNTHSGEVVVLKTPKVRQTDWYPQLNVKRVANRRGRGYCSAYAREVYEVICG